MSHVNFTHGSAVKLPILAATIALTAAATVIADDTNDQDCYTPGPDASCCYSAANATFFLNCDNGSMSLTCVGIIVEDDMYSPRTDPAVGQNGWNADKWAIIIPFEYGPLCKFRPPISCIFTGTAPDCTYSSSVYPFPCPEFLGGWVDCTLVAN